MNLTSIDTNKIISSIDLCNDLCHKNIDSQSVMELEFVLHKNRWTYKPFMRLCQVLLANKFPEKNEKRLQLSMNSNLDSNLRYRISIESTRTINTSNGKPKIL